MEPENNLQKNIGTFVGILVIIGVLFVTIFWGGAQSTTSSSSVAVQTPADNSTTTTTSQPTTKKTTKKTTSTPPPVDTPKKSSFAYKDGTYSATGSYMSPGGMDQIAVTLTLKNDLITNVSVVPEAQDGTSRRYQNMFVSGYQQYVLGKDISSVYLTTVSGSSLTPSGFDSALAQIKSQAKA
jgi:uncharacterized protein with FMN-binding domain